MIKKAAETKPIVLPCTGCSGVERIASYLADELAKSGLVEVVTLSLSQDKYATEMTNYLASRKLVAIDACSSFCSKRSLYRNALIPAIHIQLNYTSERNESHLDFTKENANQIVKKIERVLIDNKDEQEMDYIYTYY